MQWPALEDNLPVDRIATMTSIKGHFDGHAIVLDEPATLAVGQAVRVIVERSGEVEDDGATVDEANADAANDLVAAATSSTDFWDNPLDDEDWNDR